MAGQRAAGYVAVVYGSRRGLNPAKRLVLSQNTDGVPGEATATARFGTSLAAADFNGDGFSDLAVGTPNQGAPAFPRTGSVTVFFGDRNGLSNPAQVTGTNGLGTALTAADMDGDGRPEIVATEAPTNFGQIYRFTVAQGSFTPVRTEDSSVYGLGVLVSGDVNRDGRDDVIAFYNQVGGSYSFSYFPGSEAGLATGARKDYTFDGGFDAAVGDLNRDGFADLVVGRAQEPLGAPLGGTVTIWYGSAEGLPDVASQIITQDTGDVPDVSEELDGFGSAVAIGDVTGDGNPELAIGAQYEDVGDVINAGAVTVLRGSTNGITTSGQWITEGAAGTPGTAQANDLFGWMVALRDYNGDRRADLAATAIGGASEWPYYGDGSVTVLLGSDRGAIGRGARVLTGDSVGDNAAQARFGWSLSRG